MSLQTVYKYVSLICVIGIGIILLYWYGSGQPYSTLEIKERIMVLIFLALPLWFPLQGMIQNKLYTFKWSSLLCCLYFTHGVMEAWANPAARSLALSELTLSIIWFIFAIAWIKEYRKSLLSP
ncbi:hypothetical protein MNBD_GAMMA12-3651 [hydrothermal vent metagenome]|uniref:DUF2069 domain-containing protein n=1 Tax=hydrothermal vent metagenome TaxID=652676 RepID=A0A3B0Y9A7_9ZZZZ